MDKDRTKAKRKSRTEGQSGWTNGPDRSGRLKQAEQRSRSGRLEQPGQPGRSEQKNDKDRVTSGGMRGAETRGPRRGRPEGRGLARPGRSAAGESPRPVAPVEKNGVYEADVVGIGHDGEGVARVEGFTLFVPGALPGEKVRLKALKVKAQYGYAKLLDVLEPSPDRREPECGIYSQCGGCQLQHLDYAAQLRHKRQLVVDSLERIGKLTVAGPDREEGVVVHPVLGMDEPRDYRNKSQVPVGVGEEGGLAMGFYAQGSHRIIDMEDCLIQHPVIDETVAAVKGIAARLGIEPYREENHSGLLRHVVVRTGFRTGEVMVVLVTNGRSIPRLEEWIAAIRSEIKGVRSICQNINTGRTNVIFGDETAVLWGSETITDTIGDIRFAISARSFYQVNPIQTEALYRQTLAYAGLTGQETVIDAYCGIGTISLFLAQRAARVYGVEIVPEAVDDARRNAELNGIRHAEFAVGKAEEVIPAWREQGICPDVIVVDPPRKGCDAALLDTIIAMRPARVVYVSCNPATLARDLRVLEDGGFRTVEAQPVDMFPHTVHVEAVVGMQRIDT